MFQKVSGAGRQEMRVVFLDETNHSPPHAVLVERQEGGLSEQQEVVDTAFSDASYFPTRPSSIFPLEEDPTHLPSRARDLEDIHCHLLHFFLTLLGQKILRRHGFGTRKERNPKMSLLNNHIRVNIFIPLG